MKIPESRGVTLALRETEKTVKTALRALNQQAGHLMARGDYNGAEALAAKGREIQGFQSEILALRKRWSEIRSDGAGKSRNSTTPLWEYYQPILKAIVEIGGQGKREAIAPRVEAIMRHRFQPGDADRMARGQLRWEVMVRKARRHLVKEGWLRADRGVVWEITDEGRRVAKAESKAPN